MEKVIIDCKTGTETRVPLSQQEIDEILNQPAEPTPRPSEQEQIDSLTKQISTTNDTIDFILGM